MMTDKRIFEQAAAWLASQGDDDMDWSGFTAWLEADPRHRQAYDDLSLLDADLGDHRDALFDGVSVGQAVPANDDVPAHWGKRAGVGAGIAAAAAAIFLLFNPRPTAEPAQTFASPPVQSASLSLNDGTKVTLAPASRLTVRGDVLTLDGTGYFDVPHRAGRTLVVKAGAFDVMDIGTRFAVSNDHDRVSVEVAEGRLSLASKQLAKPIALAQGHGAVADSASGAIKLFAVAPANVAQWRTGKLRFDNTPLALVAQDISRYSGRKIFVDRAIAKQTFSGVVAIDERASPADSIAQILSLDARPVEGGVRLEPRH